MKRPLPVFIFLAVTFNSYAQCTPDLSCLAAGASNGVCPSSGLDTGTVGVFYSETVSVRIPEDGSDFGQPLTTIQHVDITSVDSLAPGLSYVCNPPSCHFPGNSEGCIVVSGNPTTAWDHKMTVHAMAYVKILFVNTSQAQTLGGFYSVILNPSGIETLEKERYEVGQNNPNPFNTETTISFTCIDNADVELKIFNMLGDLVFSRNLHSDKGLNTVELKADLFKPGIYIYSIGDNLNKSTRKMIVTGN
jgi:hypothetical protein